MLKRIKKLTKERIQPRVIVLSAPSGTGKTTICSKLLEKDHDLQRVITVTTRKPRKGEKEGREYFFLSRSRFYKRVRTRAFLEYAFVHGDMYGTPRSELTKVWKLKKIPILVIDVQGGLQIKKKIPDAALIFIKPPSMRVLKCRLLKRALDSHITIRHRLKNAQFELTKASQYDYIVTNDTLSRAVKKILSIIGKLK